MGDHIKRKLIFKLKIYRNHEPFIKSLQETRITMAVFS